jgi:hypothetical protein
MAYRMAKMRNAPPAPNREAIFGTNARARLAGCVIVAHLASVAMSPLTESKNVAMGSAADRDWGGPHGGWQPTAVVGARGVMGGATGMPQGPLINRK